MHQGVVGLFASVKQEVKRPSVCSPLYSFSEREEGKFRNCPYYLQVQKNIKRFKDYFTYLSALEIFPLDAGNENRGEFCEDKLGKKLI